MTTSSKPKKTKLKDTDLDVNVKTGQTVNSLDLSSDPDYAKLLEYYQNAQFAKCKEVIDSMQKQYPGHSLLLELMEDIDMKLSFMDMEISTNREEKQKGKKAILKKSVFAVIVALIVIIIYFLAYYLINKNIAAKQLEEENVYLSSLENQAEQLLLGEQPKPAAEIIGRIRTINPDYENLSELSSRLDGLIRLEAEYQTALNLIAENKDNEALVILNKIEAEKPGLWDVGQQIELIEISFQSANFIEEGNAAYQVGKWDLVISAYENALRLDPDLDDPLMNEQLLKGYMNWIISMLGNKNASIEDIEIAQEYYRKAVALTSQSKSFDSERENLQNAYNSLLVLKYTQIAKANLEDKNQTVGSIANAISYLKKAANMDPENTDIISYLKNAEDYQIAFNKFIYMDWDAAITYLDRIAVLEPNFANGNTRLMRYEAYYALGKQFSSVGLYLDAINKFGQAEILAWSDSDNLMKLFQVQVILGDTLGKLNNFEDAVSYYEYALNVIQDGNWQVNYPEITSKLAYANELITSRKFEDAFNIFQEILKNIEIIYSVSEIEINGGVCLALFASENLSTVDAILETNNLPETMALTFRQKLRVPMIEK